MVNPFEKLPVALDTHYLEPKVSQRMVKARGEQVKLVDKMLRESTCPGSNMIGWLDPTKIVSQSDMARMKAAVERLKSNSDVLLVIGVGGSYLGARAVIEALSDDPDKVVYAGQNISAHYLKRLRRQLKGKRVAINVISKSGTTTEPAIAFRLLKDLAGGDAERIVATTDAKKGALVTLAKKEGFETFVVPEDVGGRFSVLSPSGLLPIGYAGLDIDSLVSGAAKCFELCKNPVLSENPSYYYAAARNVLYHQGFKVELLAAFEPRLHYFTEWWKQLFGESEGKDNSGMFPASVIYTTDLHSLGQYVQEGRRLIAETFLKIQQGEPSVVIPKWKSDVDELNYLAGKKMSYVNEKAYQATSRAHWEGGAPNMTILLKRLDEHSLGALIYFFEIACAISGLLIGVNPFDQPGVEAYKNGMFQLLEKPGLEKAIKARQSPKYVKF